MSKFSTLDNKYESPYSIRTMKNLLALFAILLGLLTLISALGGGISSKNPVLEHLEAEAKAEEKKAEAAPAPVEAKPADAGAAPAPAPVPALVPVVPAAEGPLGNDEAESAGAPIEGFYGGCTAGCAAF